MLLNRFHFLFIVGASLCGIDTEDYGSLCSVLFDVYLKQRNDGVHGKVTQRHSPLPRHPLHVKRKGTNVYIHVKLCQLSTLPPSIHLRAERCPIYLTQNNRAEGKSTRSYSGDDCGLLWYTVVDCLRHCASTFHQKLASSTNLCRSPISAASASMS